MKKNWCFTHPLICHISAVQVAEDFFGEEIDRPTVVYFASIRFSPRNACGDCFQSRDLSPIIKSEYKSNPSVSS